MTKALLTSDTIIKNFDLDITFQVYASFDHSIQGLARLKFPPKLSHLINRKVKKDHSFN
jgi:hypothetical protein